MSRRTAMQRPPRLSDHRELVSRGSRDLSVVDAVECDDEAATCSARDSRVALAGLEMRPQARSGVSYIEDSDVVSSVGQDPDSVTSFAARPSYVARGEIVTGETRTYSPEAYAQTEAFEAASMLEQRALLLGETREEPLLPPEDRSFENAPDYVDHTMMMPASTPTPMASVRPTYRSQMMSVPPPPESWVESPWVMPSTRAPSFPAPAPRDTRSLLQTIAIIGTGVLMLAIVFGAVLFARSDSEERMEFSPQRTTAAVLPSPAATTLPAATAMQIITAPATPATSAPKPRVVATAAPVAAPTVVAPVARPVVVTPPRAKELPPKARVDAPRPAVKATAEAAPKKTKEEESVEALLKKLGEEQLSR